MKIINEIKGDIEVNEKLVKIMSFTNNGECSAIDTVIGGIAAQEVLKAASGKYTPYNQFCFYDCVECLDDKYFEKPNEEFKSDDRYQKQIEIFGKEIQKKIEESNIFLIGSGAIGCEVLKTMAMMGVAKKGIIHITDNDNIEKSNLSRQFLFRSSHIGKSKSEVAAEQVIKMNPEIHVKSYQLRVGTATENIFNRTFLVRVVNLLPIIL